MPESLNVYFAGSIRGATFDGKEACYQAIISAIQANHTLLSEHAAVTGQPEQLRDRSIYIRDMDWLERCDVMIAEVTAPSIGVGYEIAYAYHKRGLRILCLHKTDVQISAMLTGNYGLVIHEYETPEEATQIVAWFLGGEDV